MPLPPAIAFLCMALLPGFAFAQAAASGRALAASCTQCHGTHGRSQSPTIASLAGMPREQMLFAMTAYRAGRRQGEVMRMIARGYTDEELGAIADFFSRAADR